MQDEKSQNYKIVFDLKNIFVVAGSVIAIVIVVSILVFGLSKLFKSNKPGEATVEIKNEENVMNELKVEDIEVGKGQEVKDGDTVSVNYKGTLTNGKQFDSSYDRGQPFEFEVGAGDVIKGWDQGLVGMRVGGKRKLTIPSELGYGEQGAGVDIPPNSTLIFEIELLEIK